ncbi:DNA-binding transcriptional response regulator [Oleomonas cavernae]|uniref:hypothetical protein n=1 Tax=Oleomonas cavernae TaxID=2320859 RepID=UPI0038CF6391
MALLEGWGLKTAHAETTDGLGPALERLGGAADLVIADYRLADDVTGDDVIDEVARRQATPLAAIIVTGDTGPQRLRSLHGQAWPVLHKPVDPDELAKVTAALLAPAAPR